MARKWLAASAAVVLLLAGCGTKESYEPEHTEGSWHLSGDLESEIVDATFDGAQLEEGQVLTPMGVLDIAIPEGFRYLGNSGGYALAAAVDGTLKLINPEDKSLTKTLELKKSVAGAAVRGDMLAVLFASNDIALYSIASGSPLMKESGTPALASDMRIVNPYFFNDLVLFPTLDGKVVIVHSTQKQVIRSIIISSEPQFNNVVYFNVVGGTFIAATPTTLFALSDREVREAYDVRDVVFDDDGVWLTTKQGEVVALTPSLQLKGKQKFPFAHFVGLIATDEKLFMLEKEGYLIVMDKSFDSYKVYDADVDDGYVYAGSKAFYFDEETLPVE
jgi:hypothetical protein